MTLSTLSFKFVISKSKIISLHLKKIIVFYLLNSILEKYYDKNKWKYWNTSTYTKSHTDMCNNVLLYHIQSGIKDNFKRVNIMILLRDDILLVIN